MPGVGLRAADAGADNSPAVAWPIPSAASTDALLAGAVGAPGAGSATVGVDAAAGGAGGSGAAATRMSGGALGGGTGSGRNGMSSTLRCSCLVPTGASCRKRR